MSKPQQFPRVVQRYATDAEREAALFALSEHGRSGDLIGGYLGGSLAAGLGHASSDIDVYAVVAKLKSGVGRSKRVGKFRVEVKEVTVPELVELSISGKRYSDTVACRSQSRMPYERLKVLVDLYHGRDLQTCPEVSRARGEIQKTTLRKLFMSRHALTVADCTDDTAGAIGFGDWMTALESSALAVRSAAECALSGFGDIYLGEKFLFRRLARTGQGAWIGSEAWDLLHQPGGMKRVTYARCARIWTRRLLFANSVVGYCLLVAWRRTPQICERDRLGSWGVLAHSEALVRSPFFSLVRFADGIGVSGPILSFSLDEFSARVWSLLDGRSCQSLASIVAKEYRLPEVESRRRVESAVGKLRKTDLAIRSGNLVEPYGVGR